MKGKMLKAKTQRMLMNKTLTRHTQHVTFDTDSASSTSFVDRIFLMAESCQMKCITHILLNERDEIFDWYQAQWNYFKKWLGINKFEQKVAVFWQKLTKNRRFLLPGEPITATVLFD